MSDRHFTRKLPAHRGAFSYARIPILDGGVVYRLFRRDSRRGLHCEQQVFDAACPRSHCAKVLNDARHRLRNTVDDIDLKLMGVTS